MLVIPKKIFSWIREDQWWKMVEQNHKASHQRDVVQQQQSHTTNTTFTTDNSESWIALKDMKESQPVELAEFAKAHVTLPTSMPLYCGSRTPFASET
jgi:hypothetical protein